MSVARVPRRGCLQNIQGSSGKPTDAAGVSVGRMSQRRKAMCSCIGAGGRAVLRSH